MEGRQIKTAAATVHRYPHLCFPGTADVQSVCQLCQALLSANKLNQMLKTLIHEQQPSHVATCKCIYVHIEELLGWMGQLVT